MLRILCVGALLALGSTIGAGLAQEGTGSLQPHSPTLQSLDPTLGDTAPVIFLNNDPPEATPSVQPGPAGPSRCATEISFKAALAPETESSSTGACVELVDATPLIAGPEGQAVPIVNSSSAAQIELRLSERRLELDKGEDDIELREALLNAAEKRLEERAVALEALVNTVVTTLDDRDVKTSTEFAKLARMFEAMKPAEAATIFSEMSGDELMPLVSAMTARRAAAILARMEPQLASNDWPGGSPSLTDVSHRRWPA